RIAFGLLQDHRPLRRCAELDEALVEREFPRSFGVGAGRGGEQGGCKNVYKSKLRHCASGLLKTSQWQSQPFERGAMIQARLFLLRELERGDAGAGLLLAERE